MADYSSLHLDENETVIMEVRKHWIVYMGHVIAIIVAAILPWIIFLVIPYFIPVTLPYTVASYKTFFLFVYIIWLLTVWAFFFIDWTKYYLDLSED